MSEADRDISNPGHRVTHRKAPLEWHNGFPLGNGVLGAMVWGDGNPLALTLDRADLWDLRSNGVFMDHPDFNYAGLRRLVSEQRFAEAQEIFQERQRRDNPIGPTKVSIGRAELQLGAGEQYNAHLDIDKAVVEGTIRTAASEHQIQAFVHHDRNVLCLRTGNAALEAQMRLIPLAGTCDFLADLNHSKPRIQEEGGLRVLLQEIPGSGFYAVVWNTRGPDFFVAAESAETGDAAAACAKATWEAAASNGFCQLYVEHVGVWSAFWQESGVCLPQERVEFLWYYGIYLLASASRRGSLPPGLQGVWAMDGVRPPWRGDYHADMNVQETFWPACSSGHLGLLDTWCDYMKVCVEPAREFTRRFFDTEGTFWPCSSVPNYTWASDWYTVQFAWSNTGWLGWLVGSGKYVPDPGDYFAPDQHALS